MADFNQSPADQAPVTASISNFSVTIGATTVNVAGTQPASSVSGTSGTFDLAAPVVPATGMFPTWRRPERVISDR